MTLSSLSYCDESAPDTNFYIFIDFNFMFLQILYSLLSQTMSIIQPKRGPVRK